MRLAASVAAFALLLAVRTELCRAKRTPPLLEDRDSGHRKHRLHSECLFGKQHKEIGSTWFADLGPPFDVMYCIKCECIKVMKDGRITGHVKCRNIAKDCQELACEDQIQVVGRCCKVCRNDTELTDFMQDVTSIAISEEEEKSYKHYASVLSTSFYNLRREEASNTSTAVPFRQIATGRFMLHKRNLYFSFYASAAPFYSRPKLIQFVDNIGNILEEQQVSAAGSLYQNYTGKICGVWRRVSSEFRGLLKDEKLSVILVWEEFDVRIKGSLLRYRPLTTEMFSSLMFPSSEIKNNDAGGTAIVSISNVTPSVHIMIIFYGILTSNRKSENLLQFELQSVDKKNVVFSETFLVEKPSLDLNVIEFSTAVTSTDLNDLSQQRMLITLSSVKNTTIKIEGVIIPRVHCELFQTVMSWFPSIPVPPARFAPKPSKATGTTWMFVNRNSEVQYFVVIEGTTDVNVELVTARHYTFIEDLTIGIGTSNGSISSLSPKYLEQLYSEELAVNVVKMNSNSPSLLRGRLMSRPVADSRDSGSPHLLKRSDSSITADIVGFIWANIDVDCNLQYDVSLAAKETENRQFELYLEDIPYAVPGAPVTRRLLEEFNDLNVEGYRFGLSQAELKKLESGVVFFDIWDMKQGQSVLKTKWKSISIPQNCIPRVAENSSTADNNIPSDLFNDDSEPSEPARCYHGSRLYDHGSQWTSSTDECSMCNCNLGEIKCDKIPCPTLSCSQMFKIPGSCCSVCNNLTTILSANISDSACSLGGQSYLPGASWHPYIPPNGFDTCTVCNCDIATFRVNCGRISCPTLNCDEKLAFRPEKRSCCKICPNKTKTLYDTALSDQQDIRTKTERDILLSGGCKYPYGGPYENGKEWHPRIYFHGVERCVTCRCKDGNVRCERKKCTKRSCDDQCCMSKAKCIKQRKSKEEVQIKE